MREQRSADVEVVLKEAGRPLHIRDVVELYANKYPDKAAACGSQERLYGIISQALAVGANSPKLRVRRATSSRSGVYEYYSVADEIIASFAPPQVGSAVTIPETPDAPPPPWDLELASENQLDQFIDRLKDLYWWASGQKKNTTVERVRVHDGNEALNHVRRCVGCRQFRKYPGAQ